MGQLTTDDITVVILAGGKGSRMGGKDKGLVNYRNQSLIEHVINSISRQTDRIIINANRNLSQYSAFGFPVVEDTLNNFQGPLAGFLAAMSSVITDYILTVPCDSPLVIDDYLQKMIQAKNESSCDIAVAYDGERMQPVYALIPVSLQNSLKQFLENGDRKIDLWYRQHKIKLVEFPAESQLFINMNRPEDLHAHVNEN